MMAAPVVRCIQPFRSFVVLKFLVLLGCIIIIGPFCDNCTVFSCRLDSNLMYVVCAHRLSQRWSQSMWSA